MKSSEFNAYKTNFRTVIRKVLSESEQGSMDEAGFPAYSHPNPLINWLFWQRLHKVMNFIEQNSPYARVLDFGCGSGVMLPFLCGISTRVTAMDIDLLPFEQVNRLEPFPANLEVHNSHKVSLKDLPKASFNVIVATDVLEHVDDLPGTLENIKALLSPGGQIVISGPTENIIYKIGRVLAGPEYSGDYHERGIREVRDLLSKQMRVIHIATLYRPLPLFEIFAGQVR